MSDKIRILIIEDEALIAESLRYCLEDLGYEVVNTCYNYDEAYLAITSTRFDLVMLDINLGESDESRNGFSLAQLINENLRIPFIFITAYNDVTTIKTAAKLQPYGYLIKPINNVMLFATVQVAIERFNKNTVAVEPDNYLKKPEYFFVKLGTRTHKVQWSQVYCIEAGKNYVKLRLRNSSNEYPIRGSLSYVINNLLPDHLTDNFIKVNRSYYLNKNYITSYDKQFVYCGNERFINSIQSKLSADEL
jgi:two-component system, LytTR family, response regulator LytT